MASQRTPTQCPPLIVEEMADGMMLLWTGKQMAAGRRLMLREKLAEGKGPLLRGKQVAEGGGWRRMDIAPKRLAIRLRIRMNMACVG